MFCHDRRDASAGRFVLRLQTMGGGGQVATDLNICIFIQWSGEKLMILIVCGGHDFDDCDFLGVIGFFVGLTLCAAVFGWDMDRVNQWLIALPLVALLLFIPAALLL